MTCPKCGKRYPESHGRCPRCGGESGSGVFQSSVVLIATGDTDGVFRSVDEVPAPLRTQLLKSTNGSNSATIMIADRRGREEIAKAMKQPPARRRLGGMRIGDESSSLRLSRNGHFTLAALLAVFLSLVMVALLR